MIHFGIKWFNLPLLLFFAIISLGALFLISSGWTSFWSTLGIPAMSPPFLDNRTIQGGLISLSKGLNPQIANPGDPFSRVMNYPSIWLMIGNVFNLKNELNYLLFCSTSIILFFIACAYLLRKFPSWGFLAALFSSSTLLAIERGNNDIICFLLIFVFAYCRKWYSVLPFFAAGVLKIYPLFALHAVAAKKDLKQFIILGATSILVIIVLYKELAIIQGGNTAAIVMAYGLKSSFLFLNTISLQTGIQSLYLNAIYLAAIILLILIFVYFFKPFFDHSNDHSESYTLFLLGATIYVYTFIFAANYDYRQIFLLLCFPYLSQGPLGSFGKYICVLVLASMNAIWLQAIGATFAVISFLAKTIIFAIFAAMISLPMIMLLCPKRSSNKFESEITAENKSQIRKEGQP